MARFPDWLENPVAEPVATPDPVQEELKQLRDAQSAAALAERERAAAEAARMEQLERLYAANQPPQPPPTSSTPQYTQVPQYTQDELLADPNKIYEVVAAAKTLGQQEIVHALSPMLENMSEGTYMATKSGLASHPYYKFAEQELDKALTKNPGLKTDPKAIKAKFNEIVGEHMQEYQTKLEADASVNEVTERRLPVKERQVQMVSEATEANADPKEKITLTEDEERYRKGFNELYMKNPKYGEITPEQWQKLKSLNKNATR